jgi:hypothetical protein
VRKTICHRSVTYTLTQYGDKLVASCNLNDGNGVQHQVFNRADVKLIANLGGA